MNCLLYCSEILAVLLFIPWSAYADQSNFTTPQFNTSEATTESFEVNSSVKSTVSTKDLEKTEVVSTKETTSVSPTKQLVQPTDTQSIQFLKKECLLVTLVCGGLILTCTFLLVTTLLLTWKVCQLHKRLKMMSSDTKLWTETKKTDQSEPEEEAKETTVLMEDLTQTNQEMKNGCAKEDGGKISEDGQTGEEKKKEETPNTEEAPAAVESSPPSKPQEEAGDSQPTAAAAASSSEVTEEPKDVP